MYDIEFVERTVGIDKHVNRFHLVISVFGGSERIHDDCRYFLFRDFPGRTFPCIYLGQFDNLSSLPVEDCQLYAKGCVFYIQQFCSLEGQSHQVGHFFRDDDRLVDIIFSIIGCFDQVAV